ncbi:MAG: DUF4199 domain-containing protein [Lewinellaceae bacterium]|nr:DUF4199 domain-containing protein [Lewinellaceae bacterium]
MTAFNKHVLTHGLIAGAIIAAIMIIMAYRIYSGADFEGSEITGYGSMILAFSLIFVGVRSYRNQHNGGHISFWLALKMGALIALIGSTIYVLAWLVYYYLFIPDFLDKFIAMALQKAADAGASAEELAAQAKDMDQYREWYKSPVGVILLTYMEVLPVAILVALISAAILRRKPETPVES